MAKSVIPQRSSRADDEKLAMEFLKGRRIKEKGKDVLCYLKPGTDEELEARAAFVRLLWQSDLSKSVRVRLAMLFNPIGNDSEPRELVFRHRSRGKRSDFDRDVRLATGVAIQVAGGMKLEAAIKEAMAAYGVKRATAFNAWKEHGKSELADLRARRTVAQISKEISAPIAGLGVVPYPRV